MQLATFFGRPTAFESFSQLGFRTVATVRLATAGSSARIESYPFPSVIHTGHLCVPTTRSPPAKRLGLCQTPPPNALYRHKVYLT
jgi:hypothetical protein